MKVYISFNYHDYPTDWFSAYMPPGGYKRATNCKTYIRQQSFPQNCKDQMLILIKLLFPAKKHIAENLTTAWAGEMYSIFVLLLNVTAFPDSGSCGNLVDQGVFLCKASSLSHQVQGG